jgi:hypothetical protein
MDFVPSEAHIYRPILLQRRTSLHLRGIKNLVMANLICTVAGAEFPWFS